MNEFNNTSGKGPTPREQQRSIYERAAEDGAWLGLFFVVMFAVSVASMHVGFLNIVALAMGLMVPFIAYRYLWRTYVACHGLIPFSALWMQGILMFGCASLILSMCSFIYMRWINPEFIIGTLRSAVEFYRENPAEGSDEIAKELQAVIDTHNVPSPVTVSVMWLWLGAFSGSLLSVFLALVSRMAKVPRSNS